MRIISGKYKGIKLDGFDLVGTRPTMDRVKESLFSMIQNYLPDRCILDLFSGSGNLGFEALSFGARKIYLVDSNKLAIKTIIKNKNKLNLMDSDIEIINKDYRKALEIFSLKNIKFDVIFLDPPYKSDYIYNSIKLIDKYNLVNVDGLIICESDSLDKIIYSDNYLNVKEKKYGDKYIVLLKKVC